MLRSIRPLLAAGLTLLAGLVIAQSEDRLPRESAYLGEIRRGPDGKLQVMSEAPATDAAQPAAAATLVVGPGQKVATLTEAARLARDGEVIEIRAGDYRGQSAVWTQNNLTIRGAGGRPVMLADGKSAEGKAIWVVRGGKVRIENIEFRGARVPSLNGAGIRFERGELTVSNCGFFDNEMGILTANNREQQLMVIDSEFGDAPRTQTDFHHLIYVGAIGKFTLRGSRFSNGYYGHLVKSRAAENHILYNMLVDGAGGKASYELEFPNGGVAYVIGNTIGQSAGTENPAIVAYGAEGPRWPENALYFAHNTLINDYHTGNFLNVRTDRMAADIEIWAINNLSVGRGDFFKPAQGRFEGNLTAPRADMLEIGGVPAKVPVLSPLRGAVRVPGSANGVSLLPSAAFRFPVGTQPARAGSALLPGAFQ